MPLQTEAPVPRVANTPRDVIVRRMGLADYQSTWQAMRAFTEERDEYTANQLWLLEHAPIYTYGVAGREAHLPRESADIPVLKVDRGGQITYHGPGQLILYVLWDIARAGITIRRLVRDLEQAVMTLMSHYGLSAHRQDGAPGVYVEGAKVASLGLKIRRGRSYHGLALNVDMDLKPFLQIDPCGYPQMPVTQLRDLGIAEDKAMVGERLLEQVRKKLGVLQ